MCTIVLLVDAHPRYPVLVAANRDEFHARAADGPRVLVPATRAVGGRDALAGGTWMGVSARGLFAGLTNQRTGEGPAPGLRSRGEVPLGVLACRVDCHARELLDKLLPAYVGNSPLHRGRPKPVKHDFKSPHVTLIPALAAETTAAHFLRERKPPQPFAAVVLGHARQTDVPGHRRKPACQKMLAL